MMDEGKIAVLFVCGLVVVIAFVMSGIPVDLIVWWSNKRFIKPPND